MFFTLKPYIVKQFTIAAILNLGHILCGYTLAWSSPAIPKLQSALQSPLPYVFSLTQASFVASIYAIGPFIVIFGIGYISNKIGRKRCIILGGIITGFSYILVTFANTFAMLICARIFSGVGLFIIATMDLVYIGEIASPNVRGLILTSTVLFHNLGGLLVASCGPFVSFHALGYIPLCIAVLHIIGCFYIPDSPVYFVMHGNIDAARTALIRLGRSNVEQTLEDIRKNNPNESQRKWTLAEMITDTCNRKSLLLTAALMFFQESSGILVVISFAITIFQSVGSSIEPPAASIIVSATLLAFALIAVMIIEKFGRRILLMVSTASCCFCMSMFGVYYCLDLKEYPTVKKLRWLPLAIMMLTCMCYSIGLSAIPNTYMGELFRPNVRSIGTTISTMIGWIVALVWLSSFGYVIDYYGIHILFWMFAGINAFAFLFTLMLVPETKGMTLTEIESMLSK